MQVVKFSIAVMGVVLCSACSDSLGSPSDEPGSGGKSGGSGSGAAPGTGGTPGSGGGNPGSGGAGSGATGSGATGSGGVPGTGGIAGSGGLGAGGPTDYPLDCGANGIVLEAHGPPENRINYIIVGDGYTAADLENVYRTHLDAMLASDGDSPGRFDPELEPYRTYRNFINICALKIVSNSSGIPEGTAEGNGQGCPSLSDTAFDGCGNDGSRLGYINNQKVNAAIEANLPASIEMDWVAVMLNSSEWWNSGGIPMVWSGGHVDASLAAQHEGGHGFFRLGDEYGSCGGNRINVTSNQSTTDGKWQHYLGTTQDVDAVTAGDQGTGEQSTFACDGNAFRPSDDSVMNSLWASSWHNSISLENAVRSIYEIIDPIDSNTPTSTTTPGVLEVKVIDPAVIAVEWSVDGTVVANGATFDVASRNLPSGSHSITARAFDPTPWVPMDTPHGREELEQTVEWTISVP